VLYNGVVPVTQLLSPSDASVGRMRYRRPSGGPTKHLLDVEKEIESAPVRSHLLSTSTRLRLVSITTPHSPTSRERLPAMRHRRPCGSMGCGPPAALHVLRVAPPRLPAKGSQSNKLFELVAEAERAAVFSHVNMMRRTSALGRRGPKKERQKVACQAYVCALFALTNVMSSTVIRWADKQPHVN